MRFGQIVFYTFLLVGLYIVATNPGGVVSAMRAAITGYAGSVGVLQGRNVTFGSTGQTSIGGIVR